MTCKNPGVCAETEHTDECLAPVCLDCEEAESHKANHPTDEFIVLNGGHEHLYQCVAQESDFDAVTMHLGKVIGVFVRQEVRKERVALATRLIDIAKKCEAGGHKSRGRMFRAVAEEVLARRS